MFFFTVTTDEKILVWILYRCAKKKTFYVQKRVLQVFYVKTHSPLMKNRKNDRRDASLHVDHRGDVHFVPV